MPSRKRSPHPGIVILKPQPSTRRPALIRWRDPESGRFKTERLPDLQGSLLRAWLRKRSHELEGQRLAKGVRRAVKDKLSVGGLVEKYFDEVRLRPATVTAYTRSTNTLLAWPDLPQRATDLTKEALRELRAWLNRQELRPATVNFHLRQLHVVLEHSRKAGRVPALDRDGLADGLQQFRMHLERPEPLSREQIRQLVLALNRFIGEARNDEPAGPQDNFRRFVLFLLLSGCRAGEGYALGPEDIRGDHIWLPGHKVKTHRARAIPFNVAPFLTHLLRDFKGFGLNYSNATYARSQIDVPFDWTFQQLRVTCGSYLTCAPGIYGGASAYMSAARLGHSVSIAEKHYVGSVSVPPEAKTLEEAYGVADLLQPC